MEAGRHNPAWLDDAVFYEIYPQSFYDSNADGIGDLQGIIQKLPYIRELGCNAIWMNPCFKSPFMDAGYDVSDYYSVAPRYGTNADLKALFDAVHAAGMHIILDLVPGHTSWEHPWFKESMQPEKNEFTDRYVWTDSVWAFPEGFQTLRGISQRNGSAITNFFSTQPALNYGFYRCDEPWQQPMDAPGPMASRQELKKIMTFWLGLGCDGFRVDMAGSLVKNDPDSIGILALWQDVRAYLDETFPEAVILSEWGEPDKAIAAGFNMDFLLHFGPSHYLDLYHCDAPFFSRDERGNLLPFSEKFMELREKTGEKGLICIPSGNHDMERMSFYLSPRQQRLAFAFLLTMPGAPFIYYGDEIGMRYQAELPSKEGGFHRTGSRTPMQWTGGINGGFSAAAPEQLYLPVDSRADAANAADQCADPGSLRSEVKSLIALRQAHPALQNRGDFAFTAVGYPLVYARQAGGEKITVVLNPGDHSSAVEGISGRILYRIGDAEISGGKLTAGPESAAIILE